MSSMLAEESDANWLTLWMSQDVKRSSEVPNEFVSDMSMALLNAAVRSYTHCPSVADYIDLMLNLLRGDTVNRFVPQCFIRIDIAHFIKNVTKCEELNNSPKKVRDFYIRCVAILLQITDFQKAEEHIFSVLVVALSSTEGTLHNFCIL